MFTGNPGNFEPLRDEDSEGPGQRGVAHHTKPESAEKVEEAIDSYGMNMVASDEISMDRSLPDTRMKECKDWHYPADLPKASVVVVFHNEGRSVLLRTIHSVINRWTKCCFQPSVCSGLQLSSLRKSCWWMTFQTKRIWER